MSRYLLLPLIIAFTIFYVPFAMASSRISDPVIPNAESTTYVVTIGDDTSLMRSSVLLERDANGRQTYAIAVDSEDETNRTIFLTDSFIPISYHSIQREGDINLTSTGKVALPDKLEAEVIYIFTFTDLLHILRGYPFNAPKTFKIKSYQSAGNDDDSFSMSVDYVEKETLNINGKEYPCHVLELNMKMSGAMRMFSFMIPDTQFWYSVEPPHRLIRYTGMGGGAGGGRDPLVIEISE